MWFVTNDLRNNTSIFMLFGKSIFISQKYENTCKDIIKWFHATMVLIKGEYEIFSNEYFDYTDKLIKLSLGRTIESFEKNQDLFKVTNTDIEILKNAKDSRNWIAHSMCDECITDNLNSNISNSTMPTEIEKHFVNIIEGEYLVSKWSHDFHDKETAIGFTKDEYIQRMKDWFYSN